MKRRETTLVIMAGLLLPCPLQAGLILDRQPHPTGGPSADTAYVDPFGDPGWQEVADDFELAQTHVISRIDWWGFYGSSIDGGGGNTPPIGDEVMRIRILMSRASDGLPGVVLHEETHSNPVRTLTGRTVFAGGPFPERKYRLDLLTPIQLDANTTYWMNITQIGAPESKFRWEYSLTPPAHDLVFWNNFGVDWEPAGITSGLAFQLYEVPEPGTMSFVSVIVVFGFSAIPRRWRKQTSNRSMNNVTITKIASTFPP